MRGHKRGRLRQLTSMAKRSYPEGQKLGGPHAQGVVAKKSYPTPEVRGGGRECQASTVQERPRGATLIQV